MLTVRGRPIFASQRFPRRRRPLSIAVCFALVWLATSVVIWTLILAP